MFNQGIFINYIDSITKKYKKKIIILFYIILFPPALYSGIYFFIAYFINMSQAGSQTSVFFDLFLNIAPNIQNLSAFLAGIILGLLLFIITLRGLRVHSFDGLKFGQFRWTRVLMSVVYFPIITGWILTSINIHFNHNDFIFLIQAINDSMLFIWTNIDLLNPYLLEYMSIILKLLPSTLATIYFIKLFIFESFEALLYSVATVHILYILFNYMIDWIIEIYNIIKETILLQIIDYKQRGK